MEQNSATENISLAWAVVKIVGFIFGIFWAVAKFGFNKNASVDQWKAESDRRYAEIKEKFRDEEAARKNEIESTRKTLQAQITEVKSHLMAGNEATLEQLRLVTSEMAKLSREVGELRGLMLAITTFKEPK